jgi:recombination protein RecA
VRKPLLGSHSCGARGMLRRASARVGQVWSGAGWARGVHGSGVRLARKKKSESEDEGGPKAGRSAALEAAISQVVAQFGKGAVMRLGDAPTQAVPVISTGSLSLDAALGIGGLPRERVVEIFGPESSGKTTLALHAIAEAQRAGGTAAFIDVENALDLSYAAKLGVNVKELLVSQAGAGEQALEIADMFVRSKAVDVVVVDSVAALVPKAEIEGEMGDHHMALQARLMSQALRKLTSSLTHSNTVLVFINQIRSKVGVLFGSPDITSGGNALKFYASVRLEIRKGQQIKRGDVVVGNATKVKVVKNKLAPPFRVAEFEILFGKGISLAGEVLDLGAAVGVVRKAGAWLSLPADTVQALQAARHAAAKKDDGDDEQWTAVLAAKPDAELPLGQGKDKARVFLDERPLVLRALKAILLKRMLDTNFHPGPALSDESDADAEDGADAPASDAAPLEK